MLCRSAPLPDRPRVAVSTPALRQPPPDTNREGFCPLSGPSRASTSAARSPQRAPGKARPARCDAGRDPAPPRARAATPGWHCGHTLRAGRCLNLSGTPAGGGVAPSRLWPPPPRAGMEMGPKLMVSTPGTARPKGSRSECNVEIGRVVACKGLLVKLHVPASKACPPQDVAFHTGILRVSAGDSRVSAHPTRPYARPPCRARPCRGVPAARVGLVVLAALPAALPAARSLRSSASRR